jgi:hypothetical protein
MWVAKSNPREENFWRVGRLGSVSVGVRRVLVFSMRAAAGLFPGHSISPQFCLRHKGNKTIGAQKPWTLSPWASTLAHWQRHMPAAGRASNFMMRCKCRRVGCPTATRHASQLRSTSCPAAGPTLYDLSSANRVQVGKQATLATPRGAASSAIEFRKPRDTPRTKAGNLRQATLALSPRQCILVLLPLC